MSGASPLAWYRRGPDEVGLRREPVPAPHTLIGSTDVPLRVFLRHEAWRDLQALFQRPADEEHAPLTEEAGILLGTVQEDEAGPYVVIDGALRASHLRLTASGITFTKETWVDLQEEYERHFVDRYVVGSFRVRHEDTTSDTTSLSEYDRYVTRRYFPDWWQVTYIVAPGAARQAMYYWHDEQLQQLPGFWIVAVDNEDEVVPAPPTAPTITPVPVGEAYATDTDVSSETDEEHDVYYRVSLIGLIILLFAMAFVGPLPGSLPSLRRQLEETTAMQQRLVTEARSLQRLNDRLAAFLAEQPPVEGRTADGERARFVAEGTPAERRRQADGGSPLLHPDESTQSDSTTVAAVDAVLPPRYVVRSGDTLWSISRQLLGDPYAYEKLASENRITDPDLILPGWEIQIEQGKPDGEEAENE